MKYIELVCYFTVFIRDYSFSHKNKMSSVQVMKSTIFMDFKMKIEQVIINIILI